MGSRTSVCAGALLWLLAVSGRAAEADALRIEERIRLRHLPFGTILDPVIEDGSITGFTRCGDSALWTGHYLAAESFRYAVTRSDTARESVLAALAGMRALIEVTGRDLPARCLVPADSPLAAGILAEEAAHGAFRGTVDGREYVWVGNTSRDQYSGVFFGLSVAFELVEEAAVRDPVRDLIRRLLERLLADNWAVIMPDGRASTVFWGRADQQLSFLQVGRRVAPERFEPVYRTYRFWYASAVAAPLAIEALDPHNSYFKFNLAAINLYSLLRWEDSSYYRWWYRRGYELWRRAVAGHGNAHFNMIARAIEGPDAARDAETRRLLEEWLARPSTDEFLDWRGTYPSCVQEDRACMPLPVPQRIRTDFLWQRSPFLLYGGGTGRVEGAGLDYLLPYWMAVYYGVL
jgi:hypothetical protein